MLWNVSLRLPFFDISSTDLTDSLLILRSDRTGNPQITVTMRQILANQQLLGTIMSLVF